MINDCELMTRHEDGPVENVAGRAGRGQTPDTRTIPDSSRAAQPRPCRVVQQEAGRAAGKVDCVKPREGGVVCVV